MPAYMRSPDRDRRRVPPGQTRKTWCVTEMWDLHKEIARRIHLGQKNVVIAKAVGCDPQTVSLVRNSPVVQEHLAIMGGAADADTVDISKRIQELAPQALDVLEEVMNAKEQASLALRAKVAESLLDRAGHAAVRTIRSEGIHAHLTSNDLDKIRQRALEKAREAGIVVQLDSCD